MLNKTILVVEDEPDLLDLIRELLEMRGYKVLNAASGREALDVWEKNLSQIDLLLTDLTLPDGMSGVALAEKVQAHRLDLKIIYTSGYAIETATKKFALPAGSRFLQKPFQPEALWKTVQASLAN